MDKLLTVEEAAERLGTTRRASCAGWSSSAASPTSSSAATSASPRRPGQASWPPAGSRLAPAGRAVMSRRRFGSVRRLPSGRWQVRYRTSDGRQHTAPETFATKADASRHLAQVETDLRRGQWSDPRLGRTTFAEWADRWQATTVNLRANTRAAYRNLLHRYLLPTFGPIPLAEHGRDGRPGLAGQAGGARAWARRRGPRPTGCWPASWARPSRAAT